MSFILESAQFLRKLIKITLSEEILEPYLSNRLNAMRCLKESPSFEQNSPQVIPSFNLTYAVGVGVLIEGARLGVKAVAKIKNDIH